MKKEAIFEADSLDCIKGFPDDVKKVMGHNIDLLQDGAHPSIAKNWSGAIWELRDNGKDGKTYRTVYVTIIESEVTVLHAFDKTTKKTSARDSKIINDRYKVVVQRKASLKRVQAKLTKPEEKPAKKRKI